MSTEKTEVSRDCRRTSTNLPNICRSFKVSRDLTPMVGTLFYSWTEVCLQKAYCVYSVCFMVSQEVSAFILVLISFIWVDISLLSTIDADSSLIRNQRSRTACRSSMIFAWRRSANATACLPLSSTSISCKSSRVSSKTVARLWAKYSTAWKEFEDSGPHRPLAYDSVPSLRGVNHSLKSYRYRNASYR